MKRFHGVSLVLCLMLTSLLFTFSCAKKTIQSDPSLETEQAATDDSAEAAEDKALEDQQLEEERLAAEQAQLQAEQDAMAAREMFENNDIFFKYDSSVVLPAAQTVLQEKAAWMNANLDVNVIVEGHCDDRGTEAYNLALGERRADAAKGYLIDLGVNPERLTTISYGEERPVDPARTEAAWAKNRRVHFAIE